jgi:hypothetical protein
MQMMDQSFYKRDTLKEMLDEAGTIQSFEQSGNVVGKIFKKQEEFQCTWL